MIRGGQFGDITLAFYQPPFGDVVRFDNQIYCALDGSVHEHVRSATVLSTHAS